jgi:hypothetical protein
MKYVITISFLISMSCAMFAACSKSKSNTSAGEEKLAGTEDSLMLDVVSDVAGIAEADAGRQVLEKLKS